MAALMIFMYLPDQLLPSDLGESSIKEVYRLLGMARIARKMKQEDMAAAINQAFQQEGKQI